MIRKAEKLRAKIELVAATREQESVVGNLLELYAHDFSEFRELNIGEDGRYGYGPLPLYWGSNERRPFLVRIGGKLAGFVLVKKGSEVSANKEVWDLAEFFILRGFRRRGAGTAVAQEVWRQLPGRWEVRVMESNLIAYKFWGRAIAKVAGKKLRATRFKKAGGDWRIFSFDT